jgi:hypothetical protein
MKRKVALLAVVVVLTGLLLVGSSPRGWADPGYGARSFASESMTR